MANKRIQPEDFRNYLVRLIRASGETLVNHAEELVGRKAGTAAFDIVIHIPLRNELAENPTPEITMRDVNAITSGCTPGLPGAPGCSGCSGVPLIETRQSYVSDEALKVVFDD